MCIYIYIYIYIYIHTHTYTYMYTYKYTCVYTYVHTYIHTYIQVHIHMHVAHPTQNKPSALNCFAASWYTFRAPTKSPSVSNIPPFFISPVGFCTAVLTSDTHFHTHARTHTHKHKHTHTYTDTRIHTHTHPCLLKHSIVTHTRLQPRRVLRCSTQLTQTHTHTLVYSLIPSQHSHIFTLETIYIE